MGSSVKARNPGRAYLVTKLRERGLSRRWAVLILKAVFDEMSKALQRDRGVEFPFGSLKRVKHVSRRWELADDEPMNAYTVEHELDAAGYVLLNGNDDPAELAFVSRGRRGKRPRPGAEKW
jgi:hypothetical protein